MRHYNKAGFSVKGIECDGKFKPFMDEEIGDMGIEINYENPYDRVHEAKINNRVIKNSL